LISVNSETSSDAAHPVSSSLADAPAQTDPSKKQLVIYLLILAALAALPYLNSLRNSFVHDDYEQVLTNPYIRNFHHLREIFTSSVWSFKGDYRGASNYYRPMMSLGYLLCYRLRGPNGTVFHLANLLINVGVVLLVFLATQRMFRSNPVAFLAACIFALHPIHSEAVDWIAAVTELELALFYLLTYWFFLISARPSGKSSIPLQAAMGASFVLALLSKEQALTLPVLAAIYEHFFRDDRAETTAVQKLRRYGALWLLLAVYMVLRVRYLGTFAPALHRLGYGKKDLVISAMALLGQYAWKLVWPAQLSACYIFPANAVALYPWALVGSATLLVLAAAFLALRKYSDQAAFGVLWLLATLAPVLNVRWMPSSAFAERYLYLASVGFCWIAGWLAFRWWNLLSLRKSRWRVALLVAAGLIALLCVLRIVRRNRDWRDSLTFYTATLAAAPDSDYMHNNLGTVYWNMGKMSAAENEWRIALRLAPNNEYALHNLGLVAQAAGRYHEAESLYWRALTAQPNYSDAHLDLGKTYEAMGRLPEAETQYHAAVRLAPLNNRAHNTLSEFYFDRRRLPEAETEARRSVEIRPTTQGYWDLGLAEWMQGNRAGAEQAFLGSAALSPSDSKAHFMLGLFYMDSGRNAEAIREYRVGLQLDPTNAEAMANLKQLEFLQIQK